MPGEQAAARRRPAAGSAGDKGAASRHPAIAWRRGAYRERAREACPGDSWQGSER
jgi:hypothetical protein